MSMEKILIFCLTALFAVAVAGCGGQQKAATSGSGSGSGNGIKVGVSMPTKSLQRWNQDGANMEAKLKEKGYDVDLQYAENKVEMQVSQIENMITKGAKEVLIIQQRPIIDLSTS